MIRGAIAVAVLCATAHADSKVVVLGDGGVAVTVDPAVAASVLGARRVVVTVHVDVPVAPAPTVVAAALPVIAPAPAVIAQHDVHDDDAAYDRANRFLAEGGLALTTGSYGAELELSMPVSGRFRIGLAGGVSEVFHTVANDFMPGTAMWDAAVELRYVGRGKLHFDAGVIAGLIYGTQIDYDQSASWTASDSGQLAGLRLAIVDELPTGGVELAVEPVVLFGLSPNGIAGPPGLAMMSSLRWELPL